MTGSSLIYHRSSQHESRKVVNRHQYVFHVPNVIVWPSTLFLLLRTCVYCSSKLLQQQVNPTPISGESHFGSVVLLLFFRYRVVGEWIHFAL